MQNWDNEIDDGARQMTEGRPDASFTAQRSGPHRHGRFSTTPQRLGKNLVSRSPLATAAVVALAIVRPPWKSDVAKPRPDTTHATPPAVLRDPSHPVAGSAVLEAKPDFQYELPGAVSGRRASEVSAFSRTVSDTSGVSDRIDMRPPLPIRVEQLGVDAMETMDAILVPGLDIAPLEVPILAVAMLDVPVMGDD